MIQNNDFLKLAFDDVYLPKHQRIRFPLRLLRFLISVPLMMMMAVSVLNQRYGYQPKNYCLYRNECISNCEELHYMDQTCKPYAGKIKYNGNTYDELYEFKYVNDDDFTTCRDYVDDNENYPWTEDHDRQWKVHACFLKYRENNSNDDNFEPDNREIYQNLTGTNINDLLCVDPGETCEVPKWTDEDCSSGTCISFAVIFAAIFIANLGQYVFEVSWLYTSNINFKPTDLDLKVNPNRAENNLNSDEEPSCEKIMKRCLGELTVAGAFLVAILCLIASLIGVHSFGRPKTVWTEWIIALVLDQVKSLIVHPAIWWTVSCRCGTIPGTFAEWKDETVMPGVNDQSMMTEIRGYFAQVLEGKYFAYGLIGLVIFYAFFVLLSLSIDEYINSYQVAVDIFYYIDLSLLVVFVTEIILKFIAWGFTYIFEPWNTVDAVIVLVSFSFSVNHNQVKGIAILRLLRLVRVLIIMRRVSESKKKLLMLKTQNQSVSSNVTRVLDLLEEISKEKTLTRENKTDLSWIMGQIQSRKLYTKSTSEDDGVLLSDYDRAWKALVKMDYEDFSEFSGLIEHKVGGDKVLKRARQSSIEMKMFNASHHVERVDQIFLTPSLDQTALERQKLDEIYKTLEKVDEWSWDVNKFAQAAEGWSFPILCLRLFLKYDIYKQYEDQLNLDKWLNYLSGLYQGYLFKNKYHNEYHILDTVQATHYFYKTAGLEMNLSELEKMVGIIAAFIHDYEHPGLTNQFLIRTKHPKAIRYSDLSPLENHHVASAFKLMEGEGDRDFLDFLDDKRLRLVRKMLIYMVTRTDMCYHFDLLSSIQGKIYAENFPGEANLEDNLMIMTFTLHCADLSKPARNWISYRTWIDNMMEEFTSQGAMEKDLNIPISSFMDEENTNKERVQLAYIDFVVRDSIDILNILSPVTLSNTIQKDLGENLNLNRKALQKKIEGEVNFS
jgi:hypothetical protein